MAFRRNGRAVDLAICAVCLAHGKKKRRGRGLQGEGAEEFPLSHIEIRTGTMGVCFSVEDECYTHTLYVTLIHCMLLSVIWIKEEGSSSHSARIALNPVRPWEEEEEKGVKWES